MKIYTRKGDDGSTGLVGNVRVLKNDVRVSAYGEVDEANAAMGVASSTLTNPDTVAILRTIQSDLFVLGAELATPDGESPQHRILASHVAQLEQWIDEASVDVSPLKNFVLPGGCAAASALHLARTVCRRAERAVITLSQDQTVGNHAVPYLNRLSDLLFALARQANHRDGVEDIPWIAP